MLPQPQHRPTHTRQAIHQLAHPARLQKHRLQPRVALICNQHRYLHGLDGGFALQEIRCCLQHGQVREHNVREVGFFQVPGVERVGGLVCGAGVGDGGDE